MLKVLDLFSGIGGFSLGLERTGGFQTVAFCEREPFCQRVLRKHWPDVPIIDDVREIIGPEMRFVDVVTGGFPCQPFSTASAGRRQGTADDRFLWPAMLRIVQGARPRWVIAENVAGIAALALNQMVSDLEACGYEVAEPIEVPACAVGHDHWRARYWFFAYSDSGGKPVGPFHAETRVLSGCGHNAGGARTAHGVSAGLDRPRQRAIGNAVNVDLIAEFGNAILQAEREAA